MGQGYMPTWRPKKGCLLVSYKIVGANPFVSSGLLAAKATEYTEVFPQPLSPTKLILI